MYRQILLDKENKDFQRLLWKQSPSSPLKRYRMTRNTYGVTPAGFHAIWPLSQLAETTKHPAASFSPKFDTYVDDLLTGASSEKEAKALQDVLIENVARAGFQHDKWSSSDIFLVDRLPECSRGTADNKHIESEEYFIKTLGVVWKPKHNIFTHNVKPSEGSPLTKQQILSKVTCIFDTLGLMAPIVIQLKSFIQALWLGQLSWDDPLNQYLVQQYQNLRHHLQPNEEVQIPRCVLDKNTSFKEEPSQRL